MQKQNQLQDSPHPATYGVSLLVIAYIGFISLGLPDTVAGVAWPSVRREFSLTQNDFGLVFLALGVGYCASGFFGGKLTQMLGLGNLLWLSCAFVAVAMFGSGFAPVWPLFVGCAVIWGLGSGGIDAGLNAYASNHFSPRHMNWLHACYSLGATIGPLMMTAVLLQTEWWTLGYVLVGSVMASMAGLFLFTRGRWSDPKRAAGEVVESSSMWAALGSRLVWLQVVLFFFYVGLEFTVGQWCFTLLTESRGVSTELAGILAGTYYGAIGVGRILTGVISHRLELDQLNRCAMLTVLAGTLLFVVGSPSELANAGLVIAGLGLAPIFPCLMARTPARLGEHSTHAVGFQVSAGMLGAALMPGLAGLLVESIGLEVIPKFALVVSVLLLGTHELIVRITAKSKRRE